jgi:MerR family Zn(II)-responsive transcriptional regulator of zntA
MKGGLTIGALAGRCGVSRDTVRFYERQRLLVAPRRTASGYRLYGEGDADRIRFIRRARAMGLTLEDIRELLTAQTLRTPEQCRRVSARLRARVQAVDEQVAQLRAFREELMRNLERCERAEAEAGCCPVVLDLSGGADAEGGE